MFKVQPSIKLFIVCLCAVGIVAAVSISTMSFFTFNNLNDSRQDMTNSSQLLIAKNQLQQALLDLNTRRQQVTIAQDVESYTQVPNGEQIKQNLSKVTDAFAQSASSFDGLDQYAKAIQTNINDLITLDTELSEQTFIVLENKQQLANTIGQMEAQVNAVVTNAESLVGKIAFQEKRVERSITRLMKKADSMPPSDFINQITDKIKDLTAGDLARLFTESNKLRIEILRLQNFASRMIATKSVDMLTSIQQNQVEQAITSAEDSLATMQEVAANNSSYSELLVEIQNNFSKMQTSLNADNATSLFAVTTQILEIEAQKQQTQQNLSAALLEVKRNISSIQSVTDDYVNLSVAQADKTEATAKTSNLIATVLATIVLLAVGYGVVLFTAKPMETATRAMWDIAEGEGDLTQRLPMAKVKEVNDFSEGFNVLIAKMQGLITDILESVSGVINVANNTAISAQETRQFVEEQRKETDSLQYSIREINDTVGLIAKEASQAFENTQNTHELTLEGKENINNVLTAMDSLASRIDKATHTMEKLADESKSVDQVLDVIRAVADKTNLLALNAAIEAARAGEQGRGFAVVADEVRVLASKTQASTSQISDILVRFQQGIGEVKSIMIDGNEKIKQDVQVSKAAVQIFNDVLNSVNQVSNYNQSIAVSTEQQATTVTQINNGLSTISEISQQTEACTQRNDKESQNLQSVADNLQRLVQQFKV